MLPSILPENVIVAWVGHVQYRVVAVVPKHMRSIRHPWLQTPKKKRYHNYRDGTPKKREKRKKPNKQKHIIATVNLLVGFAFVLNSVGHILVIDTDV
jgi:hypothetical protein